MKQATIVLNGHGPHVRFKTQGTGSVRVVSQGRVIRVPLKPSTDVQFKSAA